MSDVEWVEPYMAVVRLEKLWGIPRSFVEEIVRNVIEGGRVEVRAVPQYQYIPQIVTGRVRMVPNTLYAWGYEQLELNWKDLLRDGRKLIPSYLSVVNPTSIFRKAPEAEIKEAIRAVYDLARSNKQKPPNIKEIIEPVQNALRCKGFDTSGKHIQELAGAEEFKKQRRKPGTTVKSERHPQRT